MIEAQLIGCAELERSLCTSGLSRPALIQSRLDDLRLQLTAVNRRIEQSLRSPVLFIREFYDADLRLLETTQNTIKTLSGYSVFESTEVKMGDIPGHTISGDSGGGMFYGGKLCGLIFAGRYNADEKVSLIQCLLPFHAWFYEQVEKGPDYAGHTTLEDRRFVEARRELRTLKEENRRVEIEIAKQLKEVELLKAKVAALKQANDAENNPALGNDNNAALSNENRSSFLGNLWDRMWS